MRAWLKKEGDPELPLDFIRKKVTSEGRYEHFTPWLLEHNAFIKWVIMSPTNEGHLTSKRVLWIRWAYRTGKTTLTYHAYHALKYQEDSRTPGELWRVVPYFCKVGTGSNTRRPDFETIIRSMCSSLSLLPDSSPAQAARDRYIQSTSTQASERVSDQPYVDPRKELLHQLFKESPSESQVVFLIDALDECDLTEAYNLLHPDDVSLVQLDDSAMTRGADEARLVCDASSSTSRARQISTPHSPNCGQPSKDKATRRQHCKSRVRGGIGLLLT